ncbi:MAG: PHA synthase [Micavibrio aeruginosavorus]|uniref:PHA synthase n=1 Tax=Micavibrio aeruginosavorus TaxID=349221 RepID=A0A2W5A6T3_9BACT|nr:MAG: PHA synthase [Micavibrio aeruginosavorus]PZP56359.1 MAG: PHA synthase [Micavibrio aeruginosavorus]
MEKETTHSFVQIADEVDRLFQAKLSRSTYGLSPAGLVEIYASWLAHLALCPGRMVSLATFPFHHFKTMAEHAINANPEAIKPDPRFKAEDWSNFPWNNYVETFHAFEEFWDLATKNIPGLSPQTERAASFAARQMLDSISPANFMATNPELLFETISRCGENLRDGAMNALEDITRNMSGQQAAGMEDFTVGENLATAPGKVVFRNDLIELIQYDPVTKDVSKEPVLILPAWIMKYYILDLSPENSMIKWLVEQGHTVFIVSWKNPTADDRNLGMDDYVQDGALAAIDAVSSICDGAAIHLAGYCLGGTLAMITAALMAHDGDDRLKTLTLLAAQGDFTEAGEMMVFVTPSEVSYLDNMMWAQGYLDTKQMAGAFQMLRSYDMIWSRLVKDYLFGQRSRPFDIMAWNADATRMPYKMHSEYLKRLYLNNEFSNGHYTVLGKTVAPENINLPIFAVGTEKDHVAPWKSVYKIHLMASGDVTFVLTVGGHNAGIVSEPGHERRSFKIAHKKSGEAYQSPDQWEESAAMKDGSWWTAWGQWLGDQSSKTKIAAPKKAGNVTYKVIGDAPGAYVKSK